MHSRLFSNQEGRKFISTVKAMGNFIVTDGGLASFVTESKTVEVLVEKGPLFTQLTQYYSNDVALITRVFSPKNPDSPFKYTLQQQALVAKINITQEISYFMQSPISNNQTLVIDEADYDLRTIQTDAKPGMGCISLFLHIIHRQLLSCSFLCSDERNIKTTRSSFDHRFL